MRNGQCPPALAQTIRKILTMPRQDKEIMHASRIARELKKLHADTPLSETDLSRFVADEAVRLGVNIEMDVAPGK